MTDRGMGLPFKIINGATLTSAGRQSCPFGVFYASLLNCFLKSPTMWVRGNIFQAHWGVEIIRKKHKVLCQLLAQILHWFSKNVINHQHRHGPHTAPAAIEHPTAAVTPKGHLRGQVQRKWPCTHFSESEYERYTRGHPGVCFHL